MSDPALGMRYEDARKKVKHFARLSGVKDENGRGRIISSIINQAKLCEGQGAANEIIKEIGDKSRSFTGIGNRQVGIGNGIKSGDGRWVYENQKWIKKS